MIKVLTEVKLLFPNQELTEPQIDAWFNYFGEENVNRFRLAMMAAVKASNNFFPAPGQVQTELERSLPKELTMSAEEAMLDNKSDFPLIKDAHLFASKLSYHDPYMEYESPEELAKALRIHKAIYEREFKARFNEKQNLVLSDIRKGDIPKDAIIKALAGSPAMEITQHEVNLLKKLALK